MGKKDRSNAYKRFTQYIKKIGVVFYNTYVYGLDAGNQSKFIQGNNF